MWRFIAGISLRSTPAGGVGGRKPRGYPSTGSTRLPSAAAAPQPWHGRQRPPGSGGVDLQPSLSGERPIALRPGEGPAVVQPPATIDVLLRAQAAPGPASRLIRLQPSRRRSTTQPCSETLGSVKALAGCRDPLSRWGIEPTPDPRCDRRQCGYIQSLCLAPGIAHGVCDDPACRSPHGWDQGRRRRP